MAQAAAGRRNRAESLGDPMMLRTVVVLLVAAATLAAQQAQKITINYPTRSGASWPLFIAKEGGYYQKYGFDVNLAFANHPAGVAMVISGEAVMTSYSLESAMQASARDSSLVIVGNSLSKAVFALMARKEFNSAKDLAGRRVAVSTIGDPPYNYSVALLRRFGLAARDIQWVPVGTDANGRVLALQSGRVDATLLTPPAYFRLEASGFKTLALLADYDDIFASTMYVMKRSTFVANPRIAELLTQAHAEAVKRFYDDKAFAVQAYQVYDKQSREDVERFYDIYKNGDLFERVPYVQAAAFKYVIDQQSDPQMIGLMKGVDYAKVVDNGPVERLVRQGFFEKLFGPSIRAEQERKAKRVFK
jgi:ABC-type nitrate/sulfonate/bicarbonate transport system substrate-binding protein